MGIGGADRQCLVGGGSFPTWRRRPRRVPSVAINSTLCIIHLPVVRYVSAGLRRLSVIRRLLASFRQSLKYWRLVAEVSRRLAARRLPDRPWIYYAMSALRRASRTSRWCKINRQASRGARARPDRASDPRP